MSTKDAIEKLNKEAEKASPFEKSIAEILVCYFRDGAHEADADKVMGKKKSLMGCAKSVKDTARARQQGGVAIMTDTEVEKAIQMYYGLAEKPDFHLPLMRPMKQENKKEWNPVRYTSEDEQPLFPEEGENAISGGQEESEGRSGGKDIMSLSLDDFF